LFELRAGFELVKNDITEGLAKFGIAGVMDSGDDATVGDLPGAVKEVVGLVRKEKAEKAGLQFRAGGMAAGIAPILDREQGRDEKRMLDEGARTLVFVLELGVDVMLVVIGFLEHLEDVGIFGLEGGIDGLGDEGDRVGLVVLGLGFLGVGAIGLGGKRDEEIALIHGRAERGLEREIFPGGFVAGEINQVIGRGAFSRNRSGRLFDIIGDEKVVGRNQNRQHQESNQLFIHDMICSLNSR